MKPLNLRFAAVMLGYGGAMFLVYRDEVLGPFLAPLAVLTASVTADVLQHIGIAVVRDGAFLIHPAGFAYQVAYTCTGFVPVVTFIVCLLACSGSAKAKWSGIAVGVPVLIGVNLLRLTHLFYLGVYAPGAFAFAHEVMWEGLLAATFIGLWLGWLNRSQLRPASFRSVALSGRPEADCSRGEILSPSDDRKHGHR
ncbi:MAG: archaeosortase/exosortase family protein [Methylotetracoccus sp.]|jgi:exosortase/archaeosortase family protein|nr:archaeosortase/exosortase family protein [Methylotetracoccus sp.]